MGMNYYARIGACSHCGKADKEIHIGKNSHGWTFTFHAVDQWESPDGNAVASWERWQKVLQEEGVKIFNENNEEISFKDFYEMVERKPTEKLNHTIYCREKYPDMKDFLDPQGHSFSPGTFS